MVDFAQILASMPAGGNQVQGAIAGGRPFGGLLPDLTMQPLINLQANALFTAQSIIRFAGASKASGSAMSNSLKSTGDAFLRSAWNSAGFQYASVDTGTSIQAPRFGGGGGGFSLDM